MGLGPEMLLYEALIPSLEEVGARFERGDFFVPGDADRGQGDGRGAGHPAAAAGRDRRARRSGRSSWARSRATCTTSARTWSTSCSRAPGSRSSTWACRWRRRSSSPRSGSTQPDIVGFSAFLTTTMPMFKANINALEKAGLRGQVIVMVGGAPVTQEYADVVGADGYAADASAAVVKAKELLAAAPRDGAAPERRSSPDGRPSRSATRELRIGGGQPVRHHRRADQPDRAEDLPGAAARAATCPGSRSTSPSRSAGGAMMLDVNMGAPLADEAELMAARGPAHPGPDRPAAVPGLLDHRGAGGRAGRLPGQGAGQLGDRRGRAAGRHPPAGQAARRGGDRAAQRRGGDPRGACAGGWSWPARSSTSPPAGTGSRSRTSCSTRWPCRWARTPRWC